jgi:hypothetical protein
MPTDSDQAEHERVDVTVAISFEQGDMVVEVRGWSKLWAFKRRLRVARSQIRAVRWDPTVAKGW